MRASTLTRHFDLEKQPTSEAEDEVSRYNAICLGALQNLFGHPLELLQRWPGIKGYIQYLEHHFEPLLTDEYTAIWTAIGQQQPKTIEGCWSWFNSVCTAIRAMKAEDSSIADIWECMRVSSEAINARSIDKSTCLIATFAVLCWGSCTLQPVLEKEEADSPPALQARRPSHAGNQSLKIDLARRPILAAFRNFQRQATISRWRQPIRLHADEHSSQLHVSTLNFSSLQTIGKIRLKWVEDLSSHLNFDPRTRTLSVFKFPSFCSLTTLTTTHSPVFEGISRALYGSDSDVSIDELDYNLQLNQEVLMSYRLLFGQTSRSRKLAQSLLQCRRSEREFDELLNLLCCQPAKKLCDLPSSLWPISCRAFTDEQLQEENTYSSQDDFPLFGQRLAKLQEFNLRQQPSRLRDLWRDRRVPLQWYTFWVVLIFGSVSIVLAALQLAVAIVAIPLQGGGGDCKCAATQVGSIT